MVDGPNCVEYLDAIHRRNDPSRVPIGELGIDMLVVERVLGETFTVPPEGWSDRTYEQYFGMLARLGYDAVTVGVSPGFEVAEWAVTDDVAPISHGKRAYVTAAASRIWDRKSFDAYAWPTPESVDYSHFERAAECLPDGMKILASCGGPCEWLMWITGYEPLSYMIADDPDLVDAIAERIRDQMLAIFRHMCEIDNVCAVWISDDMGYKTGTFLSPPQMRRYVFAGQKALASVVHASGRPVLLHSCGDLHLVMDDLIDDVGIDAKHSWEDVILPVAAAKRLWGDRIAVIGGVDMDALCRRSPEEVERYTLQVLDDCAPGGGYLLGSGNTIANYVPPENYAAMLGAWRAWSKAQGPQ